MGTEWHEDQYRVEVAVECLLSYLGSNATSCPYVKLEPTITDTVSNWH